MKTVFVLFDSLNLKALSCYGYSSIHTPNFKRFAERAVVFDTHYAGSLPCMPARRDLHTGRLNFLHRSWGPLEPFDNSFASILSKSDVYTHLISDHYHYWEDGGAVYHNRYDSWEAIRGQEWDKWKALVEPPLERYREQYHGMHHPTSRGDGRIQNIVNREYMKEESDYCCPQTFNAALDFLDRNRDADNWLLNIENFDPHEPYMVPARFRERYKSGYDGPILDWPRYKRVAESPQEIQELRANYAALVTMCDEYFGRLLDYFDRHDMWKDTALVVTTDHGFLLSEHDWWGKNRMPYYEEISHIPLMIYHPAYAQYGGQHRRSITQTIDVMPTLLELHGVEVPSHVEGHSLLPLLAGEHKLREVALFGMFGSGTNVCDGRYAYYRYPEDMTKQELYEYTLMPTHTDGFFNMEELRGSTLHEGFSFTDGSPVLKVPARRNQDGQPMGHTANWAFYDCQTVLYDLQNDPDQSAPYRDPVEEKRLEDEMVKVMRANEAPPEAYTRLGIVC
jgi:arylsulfatase A-like enzyme